MRGAADREQVTASDAPCVATLSYVFDHATRNLASRLTELAFPRTVLVSSDLAAALDGLPQFSVRRLSRRRVRGIGRIDVYRLDSAPARIV